MSENTVFLINAIEHGYATQVDIEQCIHEFGGNPAVVDMYLDEPYIIGIYVGLLVARSERND